MKRSKIIRMIAGLCFVAGGIGYLARGDYLLAGIFAVAAVAMIVSAFLGKKEE